MEKELEKSTLMDIKWKNIFFDVFKVTNMSLPKWSSQVGNESLCVELPIQVNHSRRCTYTSSLYTVYNYNNILTKKKEY